MPADNADDLRIGLCLSGGGFRASFYALGALRYLAEARLLDRVDVISAVSGGSIAAGVVADRWAGFECAGRSVDAFLEHIDGPLRVTATTLNLRNRWLARSLTRPRSGGRGAALAATLGADLYQHRKLVELPDGPQVIFTATDLGYGRAFRMSRDFVGSFDLGYAEPAPEALDLAVAVAASAAFPMSFTVVQLATENLGLPRAREGVLSLVDGGVYDNLGLEWFQGWRSGRPAAARHAGFLIVVNASGPLRPASRRYGSGRALLRDLAVQYQQTLNVRVRWWVDRLIAGHDRGVYIGITLDPRAYRDADGRPIDPGFYSGALPSSLVGPLAAVRTDLDQIASEEGELLSYHGYWSLHARLSVVWPEAALAAPSWDTYRDLPADEEARFREILVSGAKRRLWRRS